MVTGEPAQQVDRANATALMLYRAALGQAAEELVQDEGRGLLRLELLENAEPSGPGGALTWLQVHRRGHGAEALAPELAARMGKLQPPRQLQTIFPERSRWRLVRLAPRGPPRVGVPRRGGRDS